MTTPVPYSRPLRWIRFDPARILQPLADAKAAVYALAHTPFQRAWMEPLREAQIRIEIAGTVRMEGAEFTDLELEAAIAPDGGELLTRSQRQAHAAARTYEWIARLPADRPLTNALLRDIHRLVVTGGDEDGCEPGALRGRGENVTFGAVPHLGVEGGPECLAAFDGLVAALLHQFREFDPLVQALAAHYHLASMHPFKGGNGRTARAFESLLLQRAGLRDHAFVAMSNYYFENRPAYVKALADVRAAGHELTAFLEFGLTGVAAQCRRLLGGIRREMQKALFRTTMRELFDRVAHTRRRAMCARQLRILDALLESGEVSPERLWRRVSGAYGSLRSPAKIYARDLASLASVRAIRVQKGDRPGAPAGTRVGANLEWPAEVTEAEFLRRIGRAS
jgi:Fic family protein